MLDSALCHKYLGNTVPELHKKRLASLSALTSSLISGADLSITSLARHSSGKASVKHKINSVWKLFSKSTLHEDIPYIYKSISQPLLNCLKEIYILVDWSGCCDKRAWLLRASLVYDGRSVPIYNEIHDSKFYNNDDIHKGFLNNL